MPAIVRHIGSRRDLNTILMARYRYHEADLWPHVKCIKLATDDCGISYDEARRVIERENSKALPAPRS